VKVVFPAPKSPSNVITSPGDTNVPSLVANSFVSIAELVSFSYFIFYTPTQMCISPIFQFTNCILFTHEDLWLFCLFKKYFSYFSHLYIMSFSNLLKYRKLTF